MTRASREKRNMKIGRRKLLCLYRNCNSVKIMRCMHALHFRQNILQLLPSSCFLFFHLVVRDFIFCALAMRIQKQTTITIAVIQLILQLSSEYHAVSFCLAIPSQNCRVIHRQPSLAYVEHSQYVLALSPA